ncbi:MAG: type II toxin-antitoxin system HipA family toxin YjjJ [Deltaproteobacteria bacterium]|nr:type II toxin-antitoxin system HipA family toxin YjjJ [Deltaproteobacteria bacterium]
MAKLREKDLVDLLRSRPHQSGGELSRALDISRATLSRRLRSLGDELLRQGGAKNTRYALQRPLRGRVGAAPIYAVDAEGDGLTIGTLALTEPYGSLLFSREPFPWPVEGPLMAQGWWEGLPYPIYDMRPRGFLGRDFARRHSEALEVSASPDEWSDDDVVHVLSRVGDDMPGNWIVGEASYRRFLDKRTRGEHFIDDDEVGTRYPELAAQVLAGGYAGSSAAGEFTKFIAARRIDGRPEHVIVKFSGADGSTAVRRWSDLLMCEHLALEMLDNSLKLPVPKSRIHEAAGRRFLEVVRFDRHGPHGRLPVCTLESLNFALVGRVEASWPDVARVLSRRGYLPEGEVERIRLLWWFGKLIANTDMHHGNLAFHPGLRLAPAYDMLPMLFAPQRGGEVPEREFEPEPPLPDERDTWHAAAQAAAAFWRRCADDLRISDGFRRHCEQHAVLLENR